MLTAVVIARDSERTIGDCIRALQFCDRILVGENHSRDKTVEQARAAGAEVRSVEWVGYGKTKNVLMRSVAEGFIFSVDADEVVTPALAAEIRQTIARPDAANGYYVSRENYFLGRPIRHCGWTPDWQLRLFRAGTGLFEEKNVHEALKVEGSLGRLSHPLRHFTYLTVEDYVLRLNRYTTLAAMDRVEKGKRFSGLRLCLDPPWTFVKMYLLKSGWRDGFPGLALCALSALNSLVKHAKIWEKTGPDKPVKP
ncbi:glycosyltransferase family 2 protein [candidate division FCPU426 bacterium]|nr:glycosyltransferase family 2 protein [candidate division FCPU426 bacterium]